MTQLTPADRVLVTSTTSGTGVLSVAAVTAGFQGLAAGLGLLVNGNTAKCMYIIDDGTNWECGIGTVTKGSPDTLTRNNVRSSSNAGAAVSWGAGTRNIRIGPVSSLLAAVDDGLNFTRDFGTGGGTANAHTLTLPYVPLSYTDGMEISYYATVDSGAGQVTVNVNSLGAKAWKDNKGQDLTGVKNGQLLKGVYKSASNAFFALTTAPVPKLQSVTTAATVTADANVDELVVVTAQAAALLLANPSGSPAQGQALVYRIKDNGTARAITYGAKFRGLGVTLPTTTVISKTLYIACVYNLTDDKWDVVSTRQEA